MRICLTDGKTVEFLSANFYTEFVVAKMNCILNLDFAEISACSRYVMFWFISGCDRDNEHVYRPWADRQNHPSAGEDGSCFQQWQYMVK